MFRKILRDTYLSIAGKFARPRAGIYIFNLHYLTRNTEVSEADIRHFRVFIQRLAAISKIIPIDEAAELCLLKDFEPKQCLVAFTYDDGYSDCLEIAEILSEFGIKAAFFLNGSYISAEQEYQTEFNKRTKEPLKKPLTWADVEKIYKLGHVIGSHTLDHFEMTKLASEEIDRQLDLNLDLLGNFIDPKNIWFAWPYGGFSYVNEEIISKSLQRHKYVFASSPSKINLVKRSINRRHIESFWPFEHIQYFLSQARK